MSAINTASVPAFYAAPSPVKELYYWGRISYQETRSPIGPEDDLSIAAPNFTFVLSIILELWQREHS